jgi:hypothetical protein
MKKGHSINKLRLIFISTTTQKLLNMMESREVLILNTKNSTLVLFLFLCVSLIISGCGGGGGGNGSKPKPPEEIVDPAPPPIVDPNPPDNGSDPAPPDDSDGNLCETGERNYHYDDGREAGVKAFKYPQCTYYAAKTFQKLAPEPGVNWGANAGAWYKNAGENGWVTTNIKDDSRLVSGSIIVWGNHVQIVSDVFSDGLIVVGMNEGWSNEHNPLDPKHDKHSVGSYTNDKGKVITVYAYTGYVYRYCIPFDDFDNQTKYWGGPFRGYILPLRQDAITLQTSEVQVIVGKGHACEERQEMIFYEALNHDSSRPTVRIVANYQRVGFTIIKNTPFEFIENELLIRLENLETNERAERVMPIHLLKDKIIEKHPPGELFIVTGLGVPNIPGFEAEGNITPGVCKVSIFIKGELVATKEFEFSVDDSYYPDKPIYP